MKIFLTEIEAYGTTFKGPNIIASSIERAEEAAVHNNLIVVGVLDSIYIDESDTAHNSVVPITGNETIH